MRKEENHPFHGIMVSSGAEVAVGWVVGASARETARAAVAVLMGLERSRAVARSMVWFVWKREREGWVCGSGGAALEVCSGGSGEEEDTDCLSPK